MLAPQIIQLSEHEGKQKIEFQCSSPIQYFKGRKKGKYNSKNLPCYEVKDQVVRSHYFIGLDWLNKDQNKAIYITPKLDIEGFQTDYLKMLLICLSDQEVAKHISNIYEIKYQEEFIEIDQSLDLLSPLLAIQFLNAVKQLVKKGLKKTYYREEKRLRAKVKGKLLVSQTLKTYTFKNKPLQTACSFDIFGLNHSENQILKAGLLFVKNYLHQFPEYRILASPILNYCLPAFDEVTLTKNIESLRVIKVSPFFKDYKETIALAQLILKRFGYSLKNTSTQKIKMPPFWINMPLLFELYTYTHLRKTYSKEVVYQYKSDYQELDFLLISQNCQMVIDAKYKRLYEEGRREKKDIRQLSGYARMTKVYEKLGKSNKEIIDCLIVYPIKDDEVYLLQELDTDNKERIKNYEGFFKLALSIPRMKKTKKNV